MRSILLIISIVTLTASTLAQIVYTPLQSDVYEFLERQSLKNNIKLDDEVKPYSRKYIAEKLTEIESVKNNLNNIEQEEYEFYKQEYAYELNNFDNERWFLFSYSDSLFSLKFSPIAGYGISTIGKANGYTRWIGFSAFGTYEDWFGASVDIQG